MIWRASNSPNILRRPCNLWPVASAAALRLNDADRYRAAVPSPIDALDQNLADGAICRAWERKLIRPPEIPAEGDTPHHRAFASDHAPTPFS
jgi:hypothetical protein